jgi:short-subunit dehydrogenase
MGEQRRWGRALVTGASCGIGEAFTRQLGAAGTDLVVVARDVARLDRLAAEVHERSGVDVEVLPADLGVAGALERVAARLATDDDPVDLLVNNAGFSHSGDFVDLDLAGELAEIDVNVGALVRLSHAAVRRMVAAGGGTVVNVGSVAAFQPAAGSATYGATKAFVLSFSQSLHEEVRLHGVTVSCVCPGLTRTEFHQRSGVTTDVPAALWQSADLVARSALDAAARHKPVEVTGWHNKAITTTTRLLPMAPVRWASSQVARRIK